MKKRKILKIIVSVFISLIILILVHEFGFYFERYIYWKDETLSCPEISRDYYKKEEYGTMHEDILFSKYYYKDDENVFTKNLDSIYVEDDKEKISLIIKNSLDILYKQDNNDFVNFDYDIITSNDYYSLVTGGRYELLHYYDIDEHILYVIQYSK